MKYRTYAGRGSEKGWTFTHETIQASRKEAARVRSELLREKESGGQQRYNAAFTIRPDGGTTRQTQPSPVA